MTSRSNDPSDQVTIAANIAEINVVGEALDRFGQAHGLDAKLLVQMQVVLDELVSNVIKYAWPEGGLHEVCVRFAATSDCLRLEIVDDGSPFNPCNASAPATRAGQRPKPGGVGIHMVTQLVDGIEYARLNGCNHLKLVKRRASAATAKQGKLMSSPSLTIVEAHSGDVCVVTLTGRIDSTNADQVMTCLSTLFSSGERSVLVDLKNVMYLTSAAFRALLVAADEAERKVARLVLCNVLGQVRELFDMGGLLDAFTIHGSQDEALAKLV